MILQVRGTHGSGKSTLARKIIESFNMEPFYVEGRKRPMGYLGSGIFVPGGYDTACGGCDSISEVAHAYHLVKHYAGLGQHVFFEGILAQHSAERLMELHRLHPTVVITLTTPLQICIDAVKARRLAKGNDKPLNTANIEKEFKGCRNGVGKLRSRGVEVLELGREEAFQYVSGRLREVLG